MIFSHWFPEPVVSPPDEALPLLVPAPEIPCQHGETKPHMVERPCPDVFGANVSCSVLHFTSCMGGQSQPDPFFTDPSRISPSRHPNSPSRLGGPGPVVSLLRGTRRFFTPWRLKPKGRHLAKNIRKPVLTFEEWADRWAPNRER